MNPTSFAIPYVCFLFLGMLLFLELGRRLHQSNDPKGANQGTGTVNSSIFGLMGLLIAFTFSGALTRFDARRQMAIEEVNNIETAWLRLDLLPAGPAEPIRDLFTKYIDSRIQSYEALPDIPAAMAEVKHTRELQGQIWAQAVAASKETTPTSRTLLLPALNQMFDTAATRVRNTELHPPPIVFGMLGFVSLSSSLLAGYNMGAAKRRKWLHMLSFSVVLTLSVYVIIDIEYPRLGLIKVDTADSILSDLRESIE
jgi:hypothetical protein